MAVIYMTHPVHGAKVAIDDAEAYYDEQNGWKRFNPETPKRVDVGGHVNEMVVEKRRGRPRSKQKD